MSIRKTTYFVTKRKIVENTLRVSDVLTHDHGSEAAGSAHGVTRRLARNNSAGTDLPTAHEANDRASSRSSSRVVENDGSISDRKIFA